LMNRKICVVCGAPAAGITGYIFYADGHSKIGAPFCEQHLDNNTAYSNPVFENKAALVLFQEKHPRLFVQRVKSKKILFLDENEASKNAT
jgi:hypothetical protein